MRQPLELQRATERSSRSTWNEFSAWLLRNSYPENSAASTVARVQRLQKAYGDLSVIFEADRLAAVISDLTYGMADHRDGRPNPSRVDIRGNLRDGLASLKNAAGLFRRYMNEKTGCGKEEAGPLSRPSIQPARAQRSIPPPRLNGADVLASAAAAMGIDLVALIARCSIWAHRDVVAELTRRDPNATWFPGVRRARPGEERRAVVDGVTLDDNSAANLAIKLAAFGGRHVDDFHACHVWPGTCYDPRYHTSVANLVLLPASVAGLSDYDQLVRASLQYRAFELFGWHPAELPVPERPAGYPLDDAWRETPPLSVQAQRAVANRTRKF